MDFTTNSNQLMIYINFTHFAEQYGVSINDKKDLDKISSSA